MSWLDHDGTIAFGVSRHGELLELRRIRRGWRIVAHLDPRDGGEMIEASWDCTSGAVAIKMFSDFLGVTPKGKKRRGPTWMHPAQGEPDPEDPA